jgi:hypothetical protein
LAFAPAIYNLRKINKINNTNKTIAKRRMWPRLESINIISGGAGVENKLFFRVSAPFWGFRVLGRMCADGVLQGREGSIFLEIRLEYTLAGYYINYRVL